MDNQASEGRQPGQAAAILRQQGISPTHQRIWVLKYLLAHPGHPSAEEVYEGTHDADPSLSKASVYNILHLFKEKGLLKTVSIDRAYLRYDIIAQEHGHFKCDSCGGIFNFDAAIDETTTRGLEGFQIRQKVIYFRGLCIDCQKTLSKVSALTKQGENKTDNPMDKNNLGPSLPSRNEHTIQNKAMCASVGAPVGNDQDSVTSGPRGPLMLQDTWFLEKLTHFDCEVIPERRMHAKGSCAYGTFTVTHGITRYTKAGIFSQIGKKTEMFLRFSTRGGRAGCGRRRARYPRLRDEVLHQRRQLGPGRQQHACVLLPGSLQIPQPEPRHQARPAHQHAQPQHQLGFLVIAA